MRWPASVADHFHLICKKVSLSPRERHLFLFFDEGFAQRICHKALPDGIASLYLMSNIDGDELEPLITQRLIIKILLSLALLALVATAITWFGHWYGERLTLAGHTESTQPLKITIGTDTLILPENVIRFREQRVEGQAESINLYLSWPQMQGYTAQDAARFNEPDKTSDLIFVEISEATMSRDMSGRYEPIYQRLITEAATDYGHGLTLHRMKQESGYAGEVLLTGARQGLPDYVIRCVLPSQPDESSSADCQRDIHMGSGLNVLYRMSSTHLPDWDHIDAAITTFVANALLEQPPSDR